MTTKPKRKLTDRQRAERYTERIRSTKPFYLSNIVTYMDRAYLAGLKAGRKEKK